MRFRFAVVAALLLVAPLMFAKDAYLSIGGSVGSFRTDARIFNPSQSKDIQVQAWYLPVGNNDNSGVQPVTITVPKRSQVLYDDVVSSLFHAGGLGAVRLKSNDDFVATQRIYAAVNGDTLGQFVGAVDATAALKNGVLIQAKNNGGGGQKGTFRTNVGAVNPNATAANITWRVYDKSNAVVGSPHVMQMPPFGVVGPTAITAFGDNIPGTADLADAWVGFVSDQPIIAYASVVDNGSTDPTYIPASADSDPPSAVTTKTFDVTLRNFAIDFTPAPAALKVGDQITLRIKATDPLHGFRLQAPSGSSVVPDRGLYRVGDTIVQNFTITEQGSYFYTCTNSACGSGHVNMFGIIDVGASSGDPGPRY